MVMDAIPARGVLVLALLAVVPIVWYGLDGTLSAAVLSAVNVVIIVAVLAYAMSPVTVDSAHEENGSPT